jgi:predicted transcriptional regulator
MPHTQKLFTPPRGEIVLLSIKPKYAELILSGDKRVEFRRSWAKKNVELLVLYSSSPVQKIVGVVNVKGTMVASPTRLWQISQEMGGGLTRAELREYFLGRAKGVGVKLGYVKRLSEPLNPFEVIVDFVAPQSFRYLAQREYMNIKKYLVD